MDFPALRKVPKTGVIYVTTEAEKHGFYENRSDWCNLGQGMPEVGQLPGAPKRMNAIPHIDEEDLEYAPIGGLRELRQAIADYYNELYREGKASKYSYENVAVSSGGRVSLTRIIASLGNINMGHFLPDYTAYEELLDIFSLYIKPIPILLEPESGFLFPPDQLQKEIRGRGLLAILLSNPTNPTGKLIEGEELEEWIAIARKENCLYIFDEFYSHFIWTGPLRVSAAAYVQDVNKDPVLIVDGLTKNWRYPGLRTTWAIGPKQIIENLISAGSFLDGGSVRFLQRISIPLLQKRYCDQEDRAIQQIFQKKRQLMIERLQSLGFSIPFAPQGTFYVFAHLGKNQKRFRDGFQFFHALLAHKVICVPGIFFDVNPGKRRFMKHSRFRQFVRFSFGPPLAEIEEGLNRMERLLNR